jgi:PIN domain nuclease of toxin-antitoxin system
VSVVSLWELILKKKRGTAPVRDPVVWWAEHVTDRETEVVPVRVPHVIQCDRLADVHSDPFDRMLVAQALSERCTLITRDALLGRYGVPILWD